MGSQLVILCTATVFCDFPFRTDPVELFHAVEGGIKGAFFDAQNVVRDLVNELGEAVAVEGAACEHFEDEEVKGALELIFGQECPLDVWVTIRWAEKKSQACSSRSGRIYADCVDVFTLQIVMACLKSP